VVWRCSAPEALPVLEQVRQEHIGGEMCWMLRTPHGLALVSLLQFVDIAKVKAQQVRIEKALARGYAGVIEGGALTKVDIALGDDAAWDGLKRLVQAP
jgi:hypothetical protein